MADKWIKVGDLEPWLYATLEESPGVRAEIDGLEVELTVRRIHGEHLFTKSATNDQVDANSAGDVHYEWESGDTDVAGGYYFEWRVHRDNGPETYRNDGHNTLAILENLEAEAS